MGYYRVSSGSNVSEQPIGPIFKGQALKMRPVGCPETSVRNYHNSRRKVRKSAGIINLAAEACKLSLLVLL